MITRLILVGENRLAREGLRQTLSNDSMIIVESVTSLSELIPLMRANAGFPELILFIPSGYREENWVSIREITIEFPKLGIAILADDCGRSSYDAALAAGVRGFLPNSISGAALALSLQLIALGENLFACPAALAKPQNILAAAAEIGKCSNLRTPLSKREAEILNCLEVGLPNKLIARKLSIAEATVKVHLKAILRKIEVDNRTQAAIWAMAHKGAISRDLTSDQGFRDAV